MRELAGNIKNVFVLLFLNLQISSYLSKHSDLVSCLTTSRPVLILSLSDSGVLTAFGCGSAGLEREKRPLVRKAITCSLKEQMESFCASFPPFPLPRAYLNDMSSPNIQLLSWECPPSSQLSTGLWACGCQEECVFASFSSVCLINPSMCVCASVAHYLSKSQICKLNVCTVMSLFVCLLGLIWAAEHVRHT